MLVVVTIGCGPPRDAADVLAAHRPRDRRIPSTHEGAVRPWVVGQWTLYKESAAGKVGYSKHAVVAVGPCGTWIESIFVSDKYDDRLTLKTCFRGANPGSLHDGLDSMQAVMMRKAQRTIVIDFRNGQNPNTRRLMKAEYANFVTLAWQSAPSTEQREVVVPAGHFLGAQKIVTTLWVDQSLHHAEVWTHDDVPLSGAIKVVDDLGTESVLLDYGMSGATSDLPDFDAQLEESGLQ